MTKQRRGVRMGERVTVSLSAGITPVQQMLASGTGALLTSLFVTPLDVVKIRLQAQRSPFYQALAVDSEPWSNVIRPSKWKCFLYCNGLMDHLYVCQNGTSCSSWYKTPTHFSGTLDAFVKITRNEGVKSLWSGLPPTLVMAVPATVIYFTCYDQLKDFLCYGMGYQGSQVPLVAGGLARLGAVTVISPLELVRTKMQSKQLSYSELRVCIRSSVAQDGWLSLWKGWGPTVLRDVPFSALYWFNYELVKAQLCAGYRVAEATFMMSFVAGAISGAVAAVMTLPFDVVKTQRQIQLGEMETLADRARQQRCGGLRGSGCSLRSLQRGTVLEEDRREDGVPCCSLITRLGDCCIATNALLPFTAPAKKPSSTWHIMGRILADSGYRGLFAGFLPRVVKVAPACAVMISTYEFGKAFFQKLNRERALQAL
ncbi:hypothetical protein SKAU_G00134720 [Synaphobranchus kaupii]|uniref:Mitochondrial glutathione transporter SLC25A39 n=1 Tax=Synaphobranchus kaupii TaxID=118154 RepID=A0A9Q1J3D6_SYNKA|nr:hypothetical protein SKAU_G00134720 [Synaphobranchus kaupii]